MKWFQHDTDASHDAKIKKLILKHGAIGYAVYFHCLELIAGNITQSNINFELEHDAEIIADNLKITGDNNLAGIDKVNNVMKTIINLGLFTTEKNKIFCFKLANRLDNTISRNPEINKIKEKINTLRSDYVDTTKKLGAEEIRLDKIRLDKIRLDKIRLDKIRLDENIEDDKCTNVQEMNDKRTPELELKKDIELDKDKESIVQSTQSINTNIKEDSSIKDKQESGYKHIQLYQSLIKSNKITYVLTKDDNIAFYSGYKKYKEAGMLDHDIELYMQNWFRKKLGKWCGYTLKNFWADISKIQANMR